MNIETTELASIEAGKVALESGSVDLMLSDWLWVTRERALGDDVVGHPRRCVAGQDETLHTRAPSCAPPAADDLDEGIARK